MKRSDGHYYVCYAGKWEIARLSEGYGWKTFDWNGYFPDSQFEKIGEKVQRYVPLVQQQEGRLASQADWISKYGDREENMMR